MRRVIGQVEALLSWHSRINVIRFDCHFPQGWKNDHKLENKVMSAFTKMLKSKLRTKQWLGHDHVITGWSYEVGEENGNGHYHFFVGFEALYRRLGSFEGGIYTGLYGLIKDCWKRVIGGHIHFSKSRIVKRSNVTQIHQCVRHLSYIAKDVTKGFGSGCTAKNYALSRLKPKPKSESTDMKGVQFSDCAGALAE
ncbi:inovirus-type Gp2 protein [Pseudomonas sp. v388]|uniref:YagK/YfjJ domain-containing protein n=1 Tax=Pseudomonas sp. v388 TaxID=2479849 RepID=UPI000F792330|nr:inovirus-type Gp2 protein [Pseudomonas sp. v388]